MDQGRRCASFASGASVFVVRLGRTIIYLSISVHVITSWHSRCVQFSIQRPNAAPFTCLQLTFKSVLQPCLWCRSLSFKITFLTSSFYLVVALRRKAKYRFCTNAVSLFYVYEKVPHKKWQHLDRDLLHHKVSGLVHLVVLSSFHFGLFTVRHINRMYIIENLVRWSGDVSSVVIYQVLLRSVRYFKNH